MIFLKPPSSDKLDVAVFSVPKLSPSGQLPLAALEMALL